VTLPIFARLNQVGWVHLWRTREAFEAGEASECCFNPRTDPRWPEVRLGAEARARLEGGQLVELEDPGYLGSEGTPEGSTTW
jgi:hypothetical protein